MHDLIWKKKQFG